MTVRPAPNADAGASRADCADAGSPDAAFADAGTLDEHCADACVDADAQTTDSGQRARIRRRGPDQAGRMPVALITFAHFATSSRT